jgi:hypothetical protein
MKKFFSTTLLASLLLVSVSGFAQNAAEKSKRPSPPALLKLELKSGAEVSVDYSQPSVKGRIIGKDLEPMNGQVWRTGANEATVFETSRDIKINGQALPTGKYALFSIRDEDGKWTFIFNKTWKQWGAYEYKKVDNALTVQATESNNADFAEKMTFEGSKDGMITLLWGNIKVGFTAE